MRKKKLWSEMTERQVNELKKNSAGSACILQSRRQAVWRPVHVNI